jgi:hypothetical protein
MLGTVEPILNFRKKMLNILLIVCTAMAFLAAVPQQTQQRQRSSLLMLLGCMILYSMVIISHTSRELVSVTTGIVDVHNDQPTTHKLQAQEQKVIITMRSQSTTSDRELTHDDRVLSEPARSRSSTSSSIEEKAIEVAADDLPAKELEPQISLQESPPLSFSSQSTTNETSNLEQSSQATSSELQDDGIDPVSWSKLKIAVYMTSHLSEKHLKFLNLCWPYASGYLPLLRNSHLILYTSAEPPQDALDRMQFKSVTVRRYGERRHGEPSGNETGTSDGGPKQMGAKRAMVDPFRKENRWFDGYDWVIRLNPDALIRRNTWIRQTMMNTSIDGIFVDFSNKHVKGLHSDFYAFRPAATNDEALRDNFHKMHTAETHLYSGFRDSIRRKRVAWLPGPRIRLGWARLIGKDSPVIHFHPYFKKCPHYFNATGYKNIY